MPTLIHSTETEFKGPLIIEKEALLRLDEIMAREIQRLKVIGNNRLSRAKQEELDELKKNFYWLHHREMSDAEVMKNTPAISERARMKLNFEDEYHWISLRLRSGKKIEANSFEEATRMSDLIDEVVISFQLRYGVDDISVLISSYNDVLSLRVRPEANGNANELYSVLREWCESTQSPLHLKLWYWTKQNAFFIAFSLIVLFAILSTIRSDSARTYIEKDRARQFAKEGIKPGQERQALQTLLALESDYQPAPPPPIAPKTLISGFVLIALIGVVIPFAPTTQISLGLGSKQIHRTRWIGRVVFISIPLYVFGLLVAHYWR